MNEAEIVHVLKEHEIDIENLSLHLMTIKKPDKKITPESSLRWFLHTHVFTEIFVCTQGSLKIESEFGTVTLGRGDVAVIPKDYYHTMQYQNVAVSKTEMRTIGVIIAKNKHQTSHDLYAQLEDLLTLRGLTVYRNQLDFCKAFYDLSLFGDEEVPLLLLLNVSLFLLRLTESDYERVGLHSGSCAKRTEDSEIDMTRFSLIEEIINSHYLDSLTSDSLAKMIYVSRRQLDRLIVARYGVPLRTVINDKRLRYAGRLLTDTDRTLTEISVSTGYSSLASFNRAFRESYGVMPSEYRRQANEVK